MSARFNKYAVSGKEDGQEVLPNKLGLTTKEQIDDAELVGFARAQEKAIRALTDSTIFSLDYLYQLHKDALGDVYDFAGKLRTANISKGNFLFPIANALPNALQNFESEFLSPISTRHFQPKELLLNLARMHAELLYIHPFREGNGRAIRMFTDLIFLIKTGKVLDFETITKNSVLHIKAVQGAASCNYKLMEELFLRMDLEL